jgi:hypothetical protein
VLVQAGRHPDVRTPELQDAITRRERLRGEHRLSYRVFPGGRAAAENAGAATTSIAVCRAAPVEPLSIKEGMRASDSIHTCLFASAPRGLQVAVYS